MGKQTLTEEQAKTLFSRNCMYVGNGDVISEQKAKNILDVKAVEYALRWTDKTAGRWFNIWTLDNCSVSYLTLTGFMQAVSYFNIEQVASEVAE